MKGVDDSDDEDDDEDSDDEDSDDEVELYENGDAIKRRRRGRAPIDKDAVRAARKENKAAVKAEAAERRKTKIKKHLKKKSCSRNKK